MLAYHYECGLGSLYVHRDRTDRLLYVHVHQHKRDCHDLTRFSSSPASLVVVTTKLALLLHHFFCIFLVILGESHHLRHPHRIHLSHKLSVSRYPHFKLPSQISVLHSVPISSSSQAIRESPSLTPAGPEHDGGDTGWVLTDKTALSGI